ncbi:MAG: ATP synthase subunit I [Thiohalomonadaceae bacterium]
MSTASLQLRHALFRLLAVQLTLTAVLALLAILLGQTGSVAWAIMFGGGVALAGSLVILWYGYRAERAGSNLVRNASLIYGSAIVRFALMMVLLATGLAILRLHPLWLLLGLSAGLLAHMFLTALVPETKRWQAKS